MPSLTQGLEEGERSMVARSTTRFPRACRGLKIRSIHHPHSRHSYLVANALQIECRRALPRQLCLVCISSPEASGVVVVACGLDGLDVQRVDEPHSHTLKWRMSRNPQYPFDAICACCSFPLRHKVERETMTEDKTSLPRLFYRPHEIFSRRSDDPSFRFGTAHHTRSSHRRID